MIGAKKPIRLCNDRRIDCPRRFTNSFMGGREECSDRDEFDGCNDDATYNVNSGSLGQVFSLDSRQAPKARQMLASNVSGASSDSDQESIAEEIETCANHRADQIIETRAKPWEGCQRVS